MRLVTLFCLLLALDGISGAQDTNFPAGPQYLVTTGSPMFLQSIATPNLSLSVPPAIPSASEKEAIPQVPSSTGLSPQADLSRIYWGGPATDEKIAGNVSDAVSQNVSAGASENASEA